MKKPRGLRISGNWKMNHSQAETRKFFETLSALKLQNGLRIEIYPPATSWKIATEMATKFHALRIGAQNLHFEKSGAFTGELSALMAQECGVSLSLVGHSERRTYFGETSSICAKKIAFLLSQKFEVLYCIGETLDEREKNKTALVLKHQIEDGLLDGFSEALEKGQLALAYEPVWAIGTGKTATTEQAEEAHKNVRQLLWDRFGMEAASRTQILYGGSVKPDNLEALLKCANIDGALIGGASLDASSFLKIIQTSAQILA